MDRKASVRIVREDNKEFKIDGSDWKLLELDGFGAFENDISTVDKAIGDGSIITSDRIAEKDQTLSMGFCVFFLICHILP